MKARFVNEALKFQRGIDPKDAMRTGDLNIRAETILKMIIPNIEYLPELDDQDDRYIESKLYNVETGNPKIDETGVQILMGRETKEDPIGIKAYSDSVAFNGYEYSDEYNDFLPLTPISDFTNNTWKQIIKHLEEYHGWDPDEWKETIKQRSAYDKRKHDPNDPEFKKTSKGIEKQGHYEGHPELVFDKEHGWVDAGELYTINKDRGIVWDPETKKWIPETDKPGLVWSFWSNQWVPEKDQYKRKEELS